MIVNNPRLTVSRDAGTVAVALGAEVTLVDVADGSRRSISAPITAEIVALAPVDGHNPAVAGGFELTWLSTESDSPVVQLPGMVVFAKQTGDGTVVVLTRSDSQGTRLCAYSGDDLSSVFEPVVLGHASAHVFEPDAEMSVVMAGLNRARQGESGEYYVRRVGWADGRPAITWGGDGVPNQLDLAAVGSGRLVAVSGDRLVMATIGAPDHDAADDLTIGDVRGGDVETLAISPDGSLISAGMVADNGLTVWSQRFGQPDRIQRGSVPEGVDTVQLAIADDGTAVVAGLRSATEAVIAVAAPDGELVERWQIEQPRSVFRHDR